MNKSTTVTIAVGALITLGAGIILLNLHKKRKAKKGTDGQVILEITVPTKYTASLIGRNEVVLKEMEQQTGTIIRFYEIDESNHKCVIKGGDITGAMKAEEIIKQKIANHSPVVEETMEVPIAARPKIIGLCGETLEEICKQSNATVWIENSNKPDYCLTKLTGTTEQINAAKALINEILEVIKQGGSSYDVVHKNDIAEESSPSPRPVLSLKKRSISQPNESFEVYVSAVVDPSKFFIQLLGPQYKQLEELTTVLTKYYSNVDNQKKHVVGKPQIGQLVAAKFDNDERYYRASIVSIQHNSVGNDQLMVDLVFLDYGDNLFVYPKDIFELTEEFMELPCQAVECFLAGVKPVNEKSPKQWSQKANERFDTLVDVAQFKNKLSAKIVTFKPGPEPNTQIPGIELYDLTNGRNINVALVLINENLAESSSSGLFGDLVNSSIFKKEDPTTTITPKPIELNLKLVTEKTLIAESLKENADLIAKTKHENGTQFDSNKFAQPEDLEPEELVEEALVEGEKTVLQYADLLKKT